MLHTFHSALAIVSNLSNCSNYPPNCSHSWNPKILQRKRTPLTPPLLKLTYYPRLFPKSATPVESAGASYALLCSPNKTYRIQQKNSSNPIMVLQPTSTNASEGGETIPRASLCSIATIEDTLELLPQEDETVAVLTKANKWHEKFAKTRTNK